MIGGKDAQGALGPQNDSLGALELIQGALIANPSSKKRCTQGTRSSEMQRQNDDRQSTTDMRGPRGSLVTSRPEKIVVNNGGWGQLLPQSARLFQNAFCAPCNSRRI